MDTCSILVIDDDPDNFCIIEAFLRDRNYNIYYIDSGREAIDALHFYKPDVILLDIMMPGMDGFEVCQSIKAMPQWQQVPIIMVTALTTKSDLSYCLEAGADDFLSKPIHRLELRARVHSMLRIKKQHDNLQSLLKLREDMVKMLIHDLRNPLTSVFLNLDLLKEEILHADLQERLDRIDASAQILQKLIDSLLQIALFESGTIRLDRKQVRVRELIDSSVEALQEIAAQKNQLLFTQVPTEADGIVFVDFILMRRTLDNLLSNAIKFSPENSSIVVAVEVVEPSKVKIQVIDFGKGVPTGLHATIFEKYEIGKLIPNVSQIGLGLAFCKMVVESHQGEISLRNNHPQGAIFEILLELM